MREILWVGVAFDPAETFEGGSPLSRQHWIITDLISDRATQRRRCWITPKSGDTLEGYTFPHGIVIDLFDQTRTRVGFGILVQDLDEGRVRLNAVTAWLHELGVVWPVSVWAWSPEVMTRPQIAEEKVG